MCSLFAVRWTIRPPDCRHSRTTRLQSAPLSTENCPPNRLATSATEDSTCVSFLFAIITPEAPRARAVRQTWVVTRESRKTLCPMRSTMTLAKNGPVVLLGHTLNWRMGQYRVWRGFQGWRLTMMILRGWQVSLGER